MWHNLEKRTFSSFCIKHWQIPAAIDFESALICGGIWSTRQFWHVHICQQMKTRRRLHEVWTCMRATTKSRLKTWRNHKTFTNTIKDAHFEESTFVSFLAFRCSLLAALAVSITAQVLSRVSKLKCQKHGGFVSSTRLLRIFEWMQIEPKTWRIVESEGRVDCR